MITELDQQIHDIDWFFTNDDKISFVASGGGKLPRSIAAMTLDSVNLLSAYFRTLPEITEVIINPALDAISGRRTNENT